MATLKWNAGAIPEQDGKLVVIAGGNSGIGYEAAEVLAGKGARVILAVRSVERGDAAHSKIRAKLPQADVEVMGLDLSDLVGVRRFADAFNQQHDTLALLINNAGVMALPYCRTADGFEMQFGTNHLGHFALTGLLLSALLAAPKARVVTVSSGAHVPGQIGFDNLDGAKRYAPWNAYSQSKLANLLFAYELQRRFEAAGTSAISVGCHPGYAETNLQGVGPRMAGSRVRESVMKVANSVFAQSAEMGALPTLYAAVAKDVHGGDYIGPSGLMGMRGYPAKVRSSARSYDVQLAQTLWQASEELTAVSFDLPAAV